MPRSDHQIGPHGLALLRAGGVSDTEGHRAAMRTAWPSAARCAEWRPVPQSASTATPGLATAGLTARRCLEPVYGEQDGPVAGLPAAIVWEARR